MADPKSSKAKGSDAESGGAGANYQVLARKYRPQTFADLIGQEAMVRTLTNAFKVNRIAHAFMLTGVRGVGKTTTARLLARALNFQREGEGRDQGGPSIELDPSGVHDAAIAGSRHPDVLEMDAASRTGVGDVREILEGVRYAAQSARYKVYIIDEVHMLSTAAFNALLKTLEEPPPHVKFIFATTEIRKVPVTVLSRCQRFDLKRVDPDVLLAHLKGIVAKEGAKVDEDGLKLIVRAAEGSVRDALSLLDQAIVQGTDGKGTSAEAVRDMLGLADRARTFELFAAALAGDGVKALAELDAQHAQGGDPAVVLRDMLDHCHDVTRAKMLGEDARFADAADHIARIRALADASAMGHLTRAWQMLLKAYDETRSAPDPYAAAAMAILRIAHAAGLPPPEAAAKLLAEGGGVAGSGAARPAAGAEASPRRTAESRAVAAEDAPSARLRVVGGEDVELDPAPTLMREPELAPERIALDVGDDVGDDYSPPGGVPLGARGGALRTWADLSALASENRDLNLRFHIDRDARPVRVEPGQVIFQPTEQAPADLATQIARKLKLWTGETWLVHADANARGGETIAEIRAREAAEALAKAKQDPLVAEALALWPDAEVRIVPRPGSRSDREQEDKGR